MKFSVIILTHNQLEYTIANPTAQRIEFDFSYHLSHLAGPHDWQNLTTRNETIPGRGVVFTNTEDPLAPRLTRMLDEGLDQLRVRDGLVDERLADRAFLPCH